MADPMRIRAQVAGDKATVRVLMSHEMETGQRKDAAGKTIPAWFIQEVSAAHNGKPVMTRPVGPGGLEEPVPAVQRQGRQGRRQDHRHLGRQQGRQAHRRSHGVVTPTARHAVACTPILVARRAAGCALAAGAQTKSAADGIAEYRKMLEDGNPAELFEAKGEALWKQKRGPKNASLEALRPRQGARRRQGRLRRDCRATSPTPNGCRTSSRACSPAWRRCRASTARRSPRRRSAAASRTTSTALATWIAGRVARPAASTCRRGMPRSALLRDRQARVLLPRRAVRLLVRVLPRRGRQAHPPAGPAQPDQEPGRRHRLRSLAGLPRQQRRDVEHAAAPERLLPPAALPVSRLRARTRRSRSASTWASMPRAPSRSRRPSSAERETST